MSGELTKVPPYSEEAENAVVACCLLDPSCVENVITRLRPDDFWTRPARLTYSAIMDIHGSGAKVEPAMLVEFMSRAHEEDGTTWLKSAGGRPYIVGLVEAVDSAANHAKYADIVVDYATKRATAFVLEEGAKMARNGEVGMSVINDGLYRLEQLKAKFAPPSGDNPIHTIKRTETEMTQWLVRGYLAKHAVTLLGAEPKAGKSTMVWSIVAALQRHDPDWCGLALPTGCETFVLSEEDDSVLMESWTAAKVDETRVPVISRNTKPTSMTLREAADVAVKHVKENPNVGLVIVDTWREWSLMPEKGENDASTTQKYFREVRRIAQAGVAVILLHHTKKDADDLVSAFSGSLALAGAADILMWLKNFGRGENSTKRCIVAKGKYQRIPPELVVDRRDDGTYVSCGEGGEARDKLVADKIAKWLLDENEWRTRKQIIAGMKEGSPDGKGVKAQRFGEALNSLVRSKAIQCLGRGVNGDANLYASLDVPLHKQPTPSA